MRADSSWVVVPWLLLASPLAAQVWTQLPGADATLARYLHAGAHDSVRNRLIVFGGQVSGAVLGDTLDHNGTQWTTRSTPVAPPARWAHGMAFDLPRARVVLFGGKDAANVLRNDTWEWDGNVWQQMQAATAPTPRMNLAMTPDPFGGGVLVHGGSVDQFVFFRDLWRWTGTQWLLLDSTGPLRTSHAMAVDPSNGDLVLFGGVPTFNTSSGETWIWSGAWRTASVAGPSPRWGHHMASDSGRSRIVLSGGVVNFVGNAETWSYERQQWFRLGDGPARFEHVLDYDSTHGRCVEAGGFPTVALDVWSFGGAAEGTIQPFGQGCGPSFGSTPALAAVNAPRLGTTLQLHTSSTTATATYLLGFSAAYTNTLSLPVDLTQFGATGCVLYVDPVRIDVAVPVAGSTTHAYAVPNDATLIGVEFFAQVVVDDLAANPAGITASNALAGTIGP